MKDSSRILPPRSTQKRVLDAGIVGQNYYLVTTKQPDNKAIDSLLERGLGMAEAKIVITEEEIDRAIEEACKLYKLPLPGIV